MAEILRQVRMRATESDNPLPDGVRYRNGHYVIDDPRADEANVGMMLEFREAWREQERHDEKVRRRLNFVRNFSMGASFGFFCSFLMTVFM